MSIKLENTIEYGWQEAIRAMRNPMNSWGKSDSDWCSIAFEKLKSDDLWLFPHTHTIVDIDAEGDEYGIGPNDYKLMKQLRDAGTDHRKFMRMIIVYVDITAPLYWWKEFDTYKVGTVASSCSTMHKIASKEFVLDDFSHDHMDSVSLACLENVIFNLNLSRNRYNDKVSDNPKDDWWQMIQLLPSSYNQKRTVMMNYEVLANIYKSRKDHKLDEWHEFCDWIKNHLSLSKLITE